ncbi:MAG TPA: hypothetical protein VLB90_08335 [Pseudomonadales bacterium]|nr:hypothetical protein [Pseudomonadales bacterium]
MMIIENFKNELLEAENILATKYSFELAEPNYIRCLEIISLSPDLQEQFEQCIIELFESRKLRNEPIAYLMFKLRWPRIKLWAEGELKKLENPIATGAPLGKILDAYDDDWDNKDFYSFI